MQVNGFAAAFEKAGHNASYAAVSNFFSVVTSAHSFATGGNNDHEYWGAPRQLADSVLLVRGCPIWPPTLSTCAQCTSMFGLPQMVAGCWICVTC